MDYTFEIKTHEGDEIIVSLMSPYNFIKEILPKDSLNGLELIEISIIRKNGENLIPVDVLLSIAHRIALILESHPNAILYYFCDNIDPIPYKNKRRKCTSQQYRDRLFSLLFEKYVKYSTKNWNDYRITTKIHNEDQYAHLIYRDEHKNNIDNLVKEFMRMFEIMEPDK